MGQRRYGLVGSVTLLAVLAAACGSSSPELPEVREVPDTPETQERAAAGADDGQDNAARLDAQELGACTDPTDDRAQRDRAVSPAHSWRFITHWRQATTELTMGQPAADPTVDDPVPLARLDPVAGEPDADEGHPSLLLRQTDAERLLAIQHAHVDVDVHLGVTEAEDDGEHAVLIVAVAGDDIAVIGDCGYDPHTRALMRFAESRDQTPAETFTGLMRGTIAIDDYEAWGPGPEETWDAPLHEHLASVPLLDSSGTLRSEITTVNGPIVEYAWGSMGSLEELVDVADAVVVGHTRQRRQESAGPPETPRDARVMTRQTFEVADIIVGDVDPAGVDVIFMGGAVGDLLVEPDGEPQFRANRAYLLFLHETPDGVDGYWTVGPGVGRYLIEDGHLVASYEADLQGNHKISPAHEDLFADLLGRSVADIAEQIAR